LDQILNCTVSTDLRWVVLLHICSTGLSDLILLEWCFPYLLLAAYRCLAPHPAMLGSPWMVHPVLTLALDPSPFCPVSPWVESQTWDQAWSWKPLGQAWSQKASVQTQS
jgi:hypothetical protein